MRICSKSTGSSQLDDLGPAAARRANCLVEGGLHGRLGPAIEEAAQPAEPERVFARRDQSRTSSASSRRLSIASNKSRRSSTVRAIGPT